MRCDRIQAEFPRWREGRLSRTVAAELERHLEGCVDCRAARRVEHALARDLSGLRLAAPPEIDARARVLAELPRGAPIRPLRPVAALPVLAAVLLGMVLLAARGVTGGPARLFPALDGTLARAAAILVRETGELLLDLAAFLLSGLRTLSIPLVAGATILALVSAMLVILRDLAAAPRLAGGREER